MFQQFCLRFLRFCAIYDPGNSFVQLRNNIIARDYYILVELFTGSLVIHFAFDATNVAGQVNMPVSMNSLVKPTRESEGMEYLRVSIAAHNFL